MTYKIAFFDTKPYDKTFFDKANDDYGFDIRYYKGTELRHTVRDYFFERDDEQIKADMEYLLHKEKEFWNCVQTRKVPNLILPEI